MIDGRYILRLSRGDVEVTIFLSCGDTVNHKSYQIVTKFYHILMLKRFRTEAIWLFMNLKKMLSRK